ncbi:hypothetical protein [Micromonospora sp. NPDC023814]|uniref:hypothetical protein n=1 Tax=Micromonospora sp. NPDC023814 TaxID=3154596 RepID=UPI00340C2CAE
MLGDAPVMKQPPLTTMAAGGLWPASHVSTLAAVPARTPTMMKMGRGRISAGRADGLRRHGGGGLGWPNLAYESIFIFDKIGL